MTIATIYSIKISKKHYIQEFPSVLYFLYNSLKEGITVNLDDFGINIGSKMFEHYEILQPQLAGIAENWSNTFGLSNLGVNNNYSQLI